MHDQANPAEGNPQQLPQTQPAPPTFNCHVYLLKLENGQVQAEVANLAGISLTAESERSALQKVVARFKETIVAHLAAGEEIPWRDAETPLPGTVERFLPMHL